LQYPSEGCESRDFGTVLWLHFMCAEARGNRPPGEKPSGHSARSTLLVGFRRRGQWRSAEAASGPTCEFRTVLHCRCGLGKRERQGRDRNKQRTIGGLFYAANGAGFRIMPARGIKTPMYWLEVRWRETRRVSSSGRNKRDGFHRKSRALSGRRNLQAMN
jgi:hypothetical protein